MTAEEVLEKHLAQYHKYGDEHLTWRCLSRG